MDAIEIKLGNTICYVGKVNPADVRSDKEYCNLYLCNESPNKIGIIYAEEVKSFATGNTKKLNIEE